MSIRFGLKTGCDRVVSEHVNHRNASLVRRVLPLVLFWGFAKKIFLSLLFYLFLISAFRFKMIIHSCSPFSRWSIRIPRSIGKRIFQCSMYFWGNGVMDWVLDTSPRLWQSYSRRTVTTTHPSTSAHGDRSVEVPQYGVCKWWCMRSNWAMESVWFDIRITLHPRLPSMLEIKMLLIKPEELPGMPPDRGIELVIEIEPILLLCIRDPIGWLLNN
jgi:hypothetical protein